MNIKINLYIISLILLVNTAFSQPIRTISFPNEHNIRNIVAISDDGRMIATGFKEVAVWDTETGEKITQFNPITGSRPSEVTTLSFSQDGKHLFVGELFWEGNVWEISTAQSVMKIHTATYFLPDEEKQRATLGGITGADFTSDGSYLITGDSNSPLQMWDTKTGEEIKSVNLGSIRSLEISPNNNQIIVQKQSSAFLIDLNTFEQLKRIDGNQIELSSNWETAFINNNQLLYLQKFDTGEIIKDYPNVETSVLSLDLSPNGLFPIIGAFERNGYEHNRRILSADSDEAIRTYEFSKDAPSNSPTSQDWHIEFFPDGKRFLTVNGTNVHIWDVSDLESAISDSVNLGN